MDHFVDKLQHLLLEMYAHLHVMKSTALSPHLQCICVWGEEEPGNKVTNNSQSCTSLLDFFLGSPVSETSVQADTYNILGIKQTS